MVSIEGTGAKYSTPEPFVGGAAYSGPQFKLDPQTQKLFDDVLAKSPLGAAKPAHSVLDNGEHASREEVDAARTELTNKLSEIKDGAHSKELVSLILSLSYSMTKHQLSSYQIQATMLVLQARADEAVEKANEEFEKTHKAQMAALWGEIGRLNKEIDKEFDKLSQWTTEEEKEQRERDKLRIEAAKAELDSAKTPQQRAAAAAKLDAVLRTAQNHNIDQLDKVDQRSGGQADTSVARAGIARLGELPSASSQVETKDVLEKFNAREPLQTHENLRDSEATNKKTAPPITLASPNASNSHLNKLRPTTIERA